MHEPLQLDREARALLNAVALFQGDFRVIDPSQDRIVQRLKCMGVVKTRASEVSLCGFAYPVVEAAITEAGRRALNGPQVVHSNERPTTPAPADWPPGQSGESA